MRSSLPLGKMSNGLYYTLDTAACNSLPLAGVVTSQSSLELPKTWHIRIGRAPISKIKLLYLEINVSHVKQQYFCTICPVAHQHRRIFDTSFTKTWDPYSHPTYNGCSLFLSIVHDYTRVTWIYLMKNKNNCVVLDQFYTYVHTHSILPLKLLVPIMSKNCVPVICYAFIIIEV